VLAGDGQPPEVHAAVWAINAALGNAGRTLTLVAADPVGSSDVASLGRLTRAMAGGEVSTLVILGGNPVYDAPADLEFQAALARVTASFHLASRDDETSLACHWHLPRSHWLESWGDARSAEGVPSVVQPLIAPLYDSRSSAELLAFLAGSATTAGHELVRETWASLLGSGEFERRWSQVLHDGLLPDAEPPPENGPVTAPGVFDALRRRAARDADGPELVFRASPAVWDGRFANNAWLQELPDPITKITWDNAALVSPATAAGLAVRGGDLLRIRAGGREIELPAWIVPGQADDSVVLPLGYGRRACGRIGDGVGCDVYPLRSSLAPGFVAGDVQVERTGATRELAETQHHAEMDELGERSQAVRIPLIVREATLAEHREHPAWVEERAPEHPELRSLWDEPPYRAEHQWGMAIDLNACTGCNACVIACQSENNIPVVGRDQVRRGREMHWIRIDRYFKGDPAEAGAVFQPVPCMHCENAPCEQVCPVAATVHDDQGLNTMVYNRCIGTRYCANNCPYKVRRFNFYNFTKDTPEVLQLAANPDVTVRSRGVMEKCTYCVQRINEGRLAAKLEGRALRDGDVKTACEQACPAHAITFGNLGDEASRVAAAKRDARNYVLLAELNNQPRTSYLGKLRNPNPELEA
jgi:molybdopterin-containing oxidoreductase family iron-sulfur binding subunit